VKLLNVFINRAYVALICAQGTYAQGVQDQTSDESKYLASISQQVKNQSYGVRRFNAITPTSKKLGYGYGVCEALSKGVSIGEIETNASIAEMNHPDWNGKADFMLTMQKSAIFNLCPQFKSLLKR
jgi:hypothetical protein